MELTIKEIMLITSRFNMFRHYCGRTCFYNELRKKDFIIFEIQSGPEIQTHPVFE